jgi:hypothetical protein
MTREEIDDLITEKILSGGRRTKAEFVREVLTAILDSIVNSEDGAVGPVKLNAGMVIDENFTYILSNGASEVPGPRFFKLVFDDYGNVSVPLPLVGEEPGYSTAEALITYLNSL